MDQAFEREWTFFMVGVRVQHCISKEMPILAIICEVYLKYNVHLNHFLVKNRHFSNV